MNDDELRNRFKQIKKDLRISYTSVGLYCGLNYKDAKHVFSQFTGKNANISNELKIKADKFLKLFGY